MKLTIESNLLEMVKRIFVCIYDFTKKLKVKTIQYSLIKTEIVSHISSSPTAVPLPEPQIYP